MLNRYTFSLNDAVFSSNRPAYLLAGVALALGVFFRLALEPLTGSLAGYLYFLPAVVIGSVAGGAVPAVATTTVATVLGLAAVGKDGLSLAELVLALGFYLNGSLIALIGGQTHRQHSEAVKATQELRSREAHLKSILDTVPDAIVVVDEEGMIRSFSAAAERAFQWHADEVIGQNISVLIPATLEDLHDGPLLRNATPGKPHVRTLLATRKDKSVFPAELSIGEVRSIPRLFTGFIRDLTFQREAETRVQTLQAELIQISRLSAMGEMAATLAHELNQPLAAIVNYHSGLKLTLGNNPNIAAPAILPTLEEATEQALRAGDIIRRIREFLDNREGEREAVAFETLMSEASALALVGFDPTSVTLRLNVERGLRPLLVDKIQIQQVILNLIRNAVEAMETQTRRELTIHGHVLGKGMAEISISDTGSGIPSELYDSLFRPFVTTKPQGMGMGLSICRTIIEAHGGKIWVEQNYPQGSIFKFTVPQARLGGGGGKNCNSRGRSRRPEFAVFSARKRRTARPHL